MQQSGSDGGRRAPSFVFLDPHGRRWPRLRRIILTAAVLMFVAAVLFVQALFVRPELRLPESVRTLKNELKALQAEVTRTKAGSEDAIWQKFYPKSPAARERIARLRAHLRGSPKNPAEIRLGFYSGWDPNSLATLEAHANKLTHVCPEWMSVIDGTGTLHVDEDAKLASLAASRGLALMPRLNNFHRGAWIPEAVENLACGPAERRDRFIRALVAHLRSARAAGVVIDWQKLDPRYRPQLTRLMIDLAAGLRRAELKLWLIVPMNNAFDLFDLAALAGHVDRFVATLYDESSAGEAPGAIASQDWVEGWLSVIAGYGEPGQWIAALGAYGYDWSSESREAKRLSFPDAMSRAASTGIDAIEVKAPAYNAFFAYREPRAHHTVCFLDAVSFLNHLRAVRAMGLGGIAIERLGTEDPQIWSVLGIPNVHAPSRAALDRLEKMRGSDTITSVGRGEIVSVEDARADGARTITADAGGRCFRGVYSTFPTYPVVYHEGAGGEHDVVLTFDDGPDRKWTPRILDILRHRGVKAVFFLVGNKAEQHPALVRRILDEGHEIGNHTYSHPNLAGISPRQIQIELNATQRLITSITGRSTTLFRPPYSADSRPRHLDEIRPLKLVQDELGYLIVLENIDPEDWQRPGADVILERVKRLRREGSIVLLHDAGGNRAQTVAALPRIIDWLHTRGDRIITLSELLRIPRDELMPPGDVEIRSPAQIVTAAGFRVWHALEEFLWAFMIAATGLVAIRTGLVALLAARHHNHRRAENGAPGSGETTCAPAPPVSVVLAAFNEASVISSTLRALLGSDYPGPIEMIVVDDGSTDETARRVEAIAATDPRVRLLQQPNHGKAEALRRGVAAASHETLVFLDADTHFAPAALRALIHPLRDPAIGAVAGHARVGNVGTFLARCQALEYLCGFNLDRRAYAEWDCITVAPGAVSAVRKSALLAAGGFSRDTLAEDTDLTLSLHRGGWRVAYAHEAFAWTEAPETLRALARQRFRWAFGTLQCLWKHRDLVFNARHRALGWFSLPSTWFFQIILVATAPLIDGLLVLSLLTGRNPAMGSYFLAFLLMDLLLAFLACGLDGEKLRKAWLIIPMRLLYRPLLSLVIWRALYRAIKGAWVTWGKLERTASVTVRGGMTNAECRMTKA